MAERTTESVLAHVQAERAMQKERYSNHDDALLNKDGWDALIEMRLRQHGESRYVRLIQVAALAVAAAEREPELGTNLRSDRGRDG
jgi:hypothetical protein